MSKTERTKEEHITDFLFEIGTMRKLPRIHRQTLLTDDVTDTISSHSYRVTMIAWFLAKMEGADPYKTVMMALLHDTGEVRSADHNWVHKRYVKIFEEEILNEQLGDLPFSELHEIASEYEERESRESVLAKDADTLDQILLLREYEWQGNKEAQRWLYGKDGDKDEKSRLKRLQTESAKKIGKIMYDRDPSAWWNNLWTDKNR